MSGRQVGRVNQQSKGETHEVSGVLQRAAVRVVADKEGEGTQEVESGGLRESRFVHDFTQVPIGRGDLPIIQAKLTIGAAGDRYEQEADRVAKDVVSRMNAPQSPTVQREEISELEEEELQKKPIVQRVSDVGGIAASPELEASIQGARGSGQPLADSVREPIEREFGADFSGVRVHTDAKSDQLNRSIQAKAFTAGNDIFFRAGEFEPGSEKGQELLVHELTHVVQQNVGTLRGSPQLQEKEQLLAQQRQEHQPIKSPLPVKSTSLTQPIIQRVLRIGEQEYSDPESIRDEAFEAAGASAAAIENLVAIGQDEEVIVKYPDWESALAAYDFTENKFDLATIEMDEAVEIPTLIHFIWMGRPPSEGAVRNILSWASRAKNTGWRIILWTDDEIRIGDWRKIMQRLSGNVEVRNILPEINPSLLEFYRLATRGKFKAFNMASDLARYSILEHYGGVYADVDIGPGLVNLEKIPILSITDVPMLAPQVRDRRALQEQLTPQELESLDLSAATNLAATRAYLANQFNNNLIITQPHSAFIRELIMNVQTRVAEDLTGQDQWSENAALITGPQAVITTMFRYLNMPERLMDYFDPETFVNWTTLEWLTEESESQTYGREVSTASSIIGKLRQFFK